MVTAAGRDRPAISLPIGTESGPDASLRRARMDIMGVAVVFCGLSDSEGMRPGARGYRGRRVPGLP